jgi:hypothetical protein
MENVRRNEERSKDGETIQTTTMEEKKEHHSGP